MSASKIPSGIYLFDVNVSNADLITNRDATTGFIKQLVPLISGKSLLKLA